MRASKNPLRPRAVLAAMTVVALTLGLPTSPASRADGRGRHRIHVGGFLRAAPNDSTDCTSPIGWCTLGQLYGSLRGQYDFAMQSVIPAAIGEAPMISFYVGQAVIETHGSKIFGIDAGSIDLSPFGQGPYSSVLTVTGGEGRFVGVQGYIQITGTIDWSTGEAVGRYSGELYLP